MMGYAALHPSYGLRAPAAGYFNVSHLIIFLEFVCTYQSNMKKQTYLSCTRF